MRANVHVSLNLFIHLMTKLTINYTDYSRQACISGLIILLNILLNQFFIGSESHRRNVRLPDRLAYIRPPRSQSVTHVEWTSSSCRLAYDCSGSPSSIQCSGILWRVALWKSCDRCLSWMVCRCCIGKQELW